MEWYIPFTIMPGIGLIILSTSNILLNLNAEITQLRKEEDEALCEIIIPRKLAQLKRLSWSIVLQYVGMFLFLLSGILAALWPAQGTLAEGTLLCGVGCVSCSLLLLIVYAFRAVHILQQHLGKG